MNYEEISLFKGNGPLRISSKVRQWEGSYRDGNFYEPSLIVAFMNLLSRGGPFADESVFFLDIGANAGSYCLLPFYDDRLTCWCYEPHNEVYDILKENILLNNLEDRVHPFNIGLWETNTLKDFRIPIDKSDSGLSTLGNHTERFKYDEKEGIYKIETIECMSLDSHFKEMKPTSPVDAIKIDAEGAELFILRGAENILKKKTLRDLAINLWTFNIICFLLGINLQPWWERQEENCMPNGKSQTSGETAFPRGADPRIR